MKHFLSISLIALFLTSFTYTQKQNKQYNYPSITHNISCREHADLVRNKSLTIEWLVTWQKHFKECAKCIKRTSYSSDDDSEQDECFCANNYKEYITLSCGHRFHKKCIAAWIVKAPIEAVCPNCRANISDKDRKKIQSLISFIKTHGQIIGRLLNLKNGLCLRTLLITEGAFVGSTIGVIGQEFKKIITDEYSDTFMIFYLHYMFSLATLYTSHKIGRFFWKVDDLSYSAHGRTEVITSGDHLNTKLRHRRKKPLKDPYLVLGFALGLISSKRLYNFYEYLNEEMDI